MKNDLNSLLAPFRVRLDQTALDKFDTYFTLLVRANEEFDLTNVPAEEIPERHFLDSLLPAIVYPEYFISGSTVCDVGSGAGFPGVPLGIFLPDIQVTLLEPMKKRSDFLIRTVHSLELKNVSVLRARAEDAGKQKEYRETFGLTVSRAVSRLSVLLEYMLPLTAKGGHALCWKGPASSDEIADAVQASSLLGGGTSADLSLPQIGDAVRTLVVTPKLKETPAAYPRRAGIPLKRPIGGR